MPEIKQPQFSQRWWCVPVVKATRRLRQVGYESQASLGYRQRPYLKPNKQPSHSGTQTIFASALRFSDPFCRYPAPFHTVGVYMSALLEQAGPGKGLLLPPHSWHSPRPDGMVGDPRPARPSLIWQWEKFPLSSQRNLEKPWGWASYPLECLCTGDDLEEGGATV